MALTVSQVAKLTGVSVRALHHYDEIGLLRPSGRSGAGYRLYSEGDLERLQQVLFFRALELPLEEIHRIMTDPQFDVAAALRMQRQMLTEKAVKLSALGEKVDAAIARLEGGRAMNEHEMKQMFYGLDASAYEAEAERRWGDTEAYKESKRRSRGYSKQDWQQIKDEGTKIFARLAELMAAGEPAEGVAAMDVAETHRLYISRWFYECSREFHARLGQLYVQDPRFTANIDAGHAGLSEYAARAFAANAGLSQGWRPEDDLR